MYNIKYYPNNSKKLLSQWLIISLFTGAGMLVSIVPQLSQKHFSVSFDRLVSAQEINEQELNKYAQAILTMEKSRQESYTEIKKIIGEAPPEIVCDQPSSYDSLPTEAQKIALNYCQSSEQIVKNSGLSVSQFNRITRMVQGDANLQKKVQNAMSEIKQ